jgi:mRNA interferase RelE/StbE
VSYKVVLSPHALRCYKKFNPAVQTDIAKGIDSLVQNPVSGAKIKRLKGRLSAHYRYRVGDYRVVYTLDPGKRLVYVDYIQHRKDVYREAE